MKAHDSTSSLTPSIGRRLVRATAVVRRQFRSIRRNTENGPAFHHHREMSDHLLKDIGILPDQFDKRYALDRYNR